MALNYSCRHSWPEWTDVNRLSGLNYPVVHSVDRHGHYVTELNWSCSDLESLLGTFGHSCVLCMRDQSMGGGTKATTRSDSNELEVTSCCPDTHWHVHTCSPELLLPNCYLLFSTCQICHYWHCSKILSFFKTF